MYETTQARGQRDAVVRALAAATVLLALGAWSGAAGPVFDAGCLASERDDLDGQRQFRALGPIVEQSREGLPEFSAVRPFYSRERDGRGREVLDVLWPLASHRVWGRESNWHVLTAFGWTADRDDPDSPYRSWIFPLLFFGRNRAGEDYGALFPLGGRILDFCGRDEVSFTLFPLYSHSRLNDLETHNVLYPLISRTTGEDVRKFRVFPFYGRAVKRGDSDKRFVLWPIWTSVRYERPGVKGGGFVLFPVYGHLKMENQESWMILPPLIRWSKSAKGRQGYYLWPFVHTASGETDKVQVWPLYGYKNTTNEQSRYALWPMIYSRHTATAAGEANSFRVFPVYFSARKTSTNTAASARSVCLWPLFDYDRVGGKSRLRVIDLWPPRNSPGIERNLAPLWTLYRFRQDPRGREHEVLWGLARWGRMTGGSYAGAVFPLVSWQGDGAKGQVRKWDFLKGLIGYERDGAVRRYRALYFVRWGVRP